MPRHLIGGKAWNLFRLQKAGLNVPPLFCIVTPDSTEIRTRAKAVLAAFDRLGAKTVAVRSSGAIEDGSEATFAGLFETCLNVDREHLIDAAIEVFKSKNAERIQLYMKDKGLSRGSMRIGVVVQKQIDSQVSGVSFSQVSPTRKSKGTCVVEAVWGLGETIVQGLDAPERYLLKHDNTTTAIDRKAGNQLTMRIASENDEQHGVIEVPVPTYKRLRRRLSSGQVRAIADAMKKIEEELPDLQPLDMEFAVEKETIFILQARRMVA